MSKIKKILNTEAMKNYMAQSQIRGIFYEDDIYGLIPHSNKNRIQVLTTKKNEFGKKIKLSLSPTNIIPLLETMMEKGMIYFDHRSFVDADGITRNYAGVGVHPSYVSDFTNGDKAEIKKANRDIAHLAKLTDQIEEFEQYLIKEA